MAKTSLSLEIGLECCKGAGHAHGETGQTASWSGVQAAEELTSELVYQLKELGFAVAVRLHADTEWTVRAIHSRSSLKATTGFDDGAKQDQSSSQIGRYLPRLVEAQLLRVVPREYGEDRARICYAKVAGAVQGGREQVYHSFREVPEAWLSPDIKGENREDPWIRESG